ncbi:MAG TPA: universal stress protein [Cyclobacteriaceae bacterium]|nr:universal stress protein [Cyclobacteriaceae bacterium]
MKKILVPIDFSNASKNASHYAAEIAAQVHAEVDLIHILNINSTSTTLMNWKKLEEQMISSADQGAEELIASIDKPVKVRFSRSAGHPFYDVVRSYARDHHEDLIVMGTHGASGIKKALIGSNAASVINNSPVPVLAIPSGSTFTGIKNILYATSMTNLDTEIKIVAKFAKKFDARITIVHVSEKGSGKRDYSNLLSILSRIAHYDKLDFVVVEGTNVAESLQNVVEERKPDVIAMFTHELSLYEKIFGKGVTRNVAFNATIPLLAYNKTSK